MNRYLLFFFYFSLFVATGCTRNNAKVNNDLKKYFDSSHVEGSFALLNNQAGGIILYNMELDTQRVTPATTFKILSTLIGVQTGKITDINAILCGDSAAGNLMTIKEAFSLSSVPCFGSLARRIGLDAMSLWVDSVSYGNKVVSSPLDSFWLNNTLRISPDEQLGFMSRLYFNQLPFQKYAQQLVCSLMLQEDNTLYKLSYTTGSGINEKGKQIGWVLGWIEENRHVYFFVTTVRSDDKTADINAIGKNIMKSSLKELGFFKGEK